jgi:hypothetical protein
MIDDAGFRIVCATTSSDELTQIIIFVIIAAIGLIGNISKARTQKRTGHTGDNRPDRKPVGQRSHSQTVRPKPGIAARQQKSPKYYEPGGFAEVLRDDVALEKTLRGHSELDLKKQRWPTRPEEEPSIQPIESMQVMDQDQGLDSMGQLDALDSEYSFEDERVSMLNVSLESPDDLTRAVLYSEIISTPVGLRDF